MLISVDGLIHRDGLKTHQITQVTDLPGAWKTELLIEIAVIKVPLPIHTDQLTAHHGPQMFRIVCVL